MDPAGQEPIPAGSMAPIAQSKATTRAQLEHNLDIPATGKKQTNEPAIRSITLLRCSN
jgi:hypothetical protein